MGIDVIVLLIVMILTDIGGSLFVWHLLNEHHKERMELEVMFAEERSKLLDRIQAPELASLPPITSNVDDNFIPYVPPNDDKAWAEYMKQVNKKKQEFMDN